jgi:hypothetical protein
MSMKNSSDTNGNRTRVLPTCSVVPQPNAPPRTHSRVKKITRRTVTLHEDVRTFMIMPLCILLIIGCVLGKNLLRKSKKTGNVRKT